MTRKSIEKEALELSINNNLALQLATGTGKSKISLEIAWRLFIQKACKARILLIVAETAHKQNWIDEIEKWNMYPLLEEKDILVMDCYASLKKHQDKHYDLIILDEGHHSASDMRLDYLDTIKADRVILLSATVKNDLLAELGRTFGDFKSITVTLQEAIDAGILREPKIYLVPLELNTEAVEHTIVHNWGKGGLHKTYVCNFANQWQYLKNKNDYPNATLKVLCTEAQKYYNISNKVDYYSRLRRLKGSAFLERKVLRLGLERKNFLGSIKTESVKLLLTKLEDKRLICFCNSIPQAEEVGNGYTIHSKKKKALKMLDKFNNKEIDKLFAIGMLQEGQNLTDIEVGIIVQLGGQEREFIQRLGRVLRAETPIQFILYHKNTRDEEYLQEVLKDINPDYIHTIKTLNEFTL